MSLKQIFCLSNSVIIVEISVLLILAILYEVAAYNIGLISGDYYKIMQNKDKDAFWKQTGKSTGLIIAMSLLIALKDYVAQLLYVSWRKYCTLGLHENYFKNMAYFRLNVLNAQSSLTSITNKNDNVDQRITQDTDKMFQALIVILPELLVTPFIMVFYWNKCYQVTGWAGPIACLILFVVATLINTFLIKIISHFVYRQERCEGDFRFQHVRVRNNAEAIAFLSGDRMEKLKSEMFLQSLISTQFSLIFRKFFLRISTTFSDYFGAIISFLALAVPLFAGKYDDLKPGDLAMLISQYSFMTMYLINCFTRLIDLSTNISVFLGTFKRINELNEWFKWNNKNANWSNTDGQQDGGEFNELYVESGSSLAYGSSGVKALINYFEMTDVCIRTPLGQDVLDNLTLQIKPGENLLITGPSGSGKTSILRALKNIWPIYKGRIQRDVQLNNPSSIMFLSSRPVLTTGSVAEQIVYPNVYKKEEWLFDEGFRCSLMEIFKFLDLDKCILEHVDHDIHKDMNINWIDQLSAGEVQRFNLARIFYHRPRIVCLDECTTALPEEMESKIMDQMINRYLMTVVSCGHRKSLQRFHQMQLILSEDHTFKLVAFRDQKQSDM